VISSATEKFRASFSARGYVTFAFQMQKGNQMPTTPCVVNSPLTSEIYYEPDGVG
jgi:hypothetical protein